MSGTSDSQADESGNANPPPDPALSSELSGSIPEVQHGRRVESNSTTYIYLHTPAPISPADEFAKLSLEVQRTVVREWVGKQRHETAHENRKQIFDFVTDILRLLLPFVLGVILIVGSILLILSGLSNEGLVSLVATGIFEVFAVWDYKKRTDRK